jgi:hypothetical protein
MEKYSCQLDCRHKLTERELVVRLSQHSVIRSLFDQRSKKVSLAIKDWIIV